MFSQLYNGKHFFLLLKRTTYFSGLGIVCNGLGMVFIHNSFGNNTHNIRQQSCLQLFKRNLTPLSRQYNSGRRKFSWLLLSLKNRPHNCGGWKSSQKIKRSFSDKYLLFSNTVFFPSPPTVVIWTTAYASWNYHLLLSWFFFVIIGFYLICLPFDPILIMESFNDQGISRLESL